MMLIMLIRKINSENTLIFYLSYIMLRTATQKNKLFILIEKNIEG
jgi:hypothetical protein